MNKALATRLRKDFLKEKYETSAARYLADDYGVRIQVKEYGDRVGFLVGTSYFYESQATTKRFAAEFMDWLAARGYTVEHADLGGRLTGSVQVSYGMKPWPKTSWADTVLVAEAE